MKVASKRDFHKCMMENEVQTGFALSIFLLRPTGLAIVFETVESHSNS